MWYEIMSTPVRLLVALIFFFLGGTLASASMCFFDRLRTGESWVHGHSHCDKCGHKLSLLDLIPFVSWELTQGHCRYCGEAVPVRYRDEEFMCGCIFVIFYIISSTIPALFSTIVIFSSTYLLGSTVSYKQFKR